MKQYEFKPNRTAYVTYPLIRSFFILGFIALVVTLVLIATAQRSLLLVPAAIFILLILYESYALRVRYKKERYVIQGDRFLHYRGGVFFDHKTELVVRNITHVKLVLPWLENKFFHTGHMFIEAAGSAGSEVHFASIDKPVQMQKYVIKLMQSNGFKLTKSQHIQQEKPSALGVAIDIFGFALFGGFIGLQVVVPLVGAIAFLGLAVLPILFGFFLIVGGIFLLLFIRFMDMIRRTYDIYSDTITYSEGFLTKRYSVIPTENLADSFLKQNLLDQIIGVYDVKISVQGTGSEIDFTNMPNGKQLEKNIDIIISKSKPLPARKQTVLKKTVTPATSVIQRDTTAKNHFRMNGPRTLLPLGIVALVAFLTLIVLAVLGALGIGTAVLVLAGSTLPVVLIMLFFGFVSKIIAFAVTKYEIKATSFQEDYDFLNKKHMDFSADKVTAIVFKRNIVDKMFNTMTATIWSIGTGETINFRNLKRIKGLEEMILSKVGMRQQQLLYLMPSHFSTVGMLKAYLPLTILMALVMIGSLAAAVVFPLLVIVPGFIILAYVFMIIYNNAYFPNSQLTFYKDYVYYRRGLLQVTEYYVLYDNVKDITTKKYPFMNTGSIRFNVAGEHILGKSQRTVSIESNAFTVPYIAGISVKDELIDLILFQRPDSQQIKRIESDIPTKHSTPVYSTKPHVPSVAFFAIVLTVFLFFLLPVMIFIVIYVVWQASVTSYHIDPYRVRRNSGILYKKQKSIIFQRIDHLTNTQGFVNKMFHTGSIGIQTTGSSSTELGIDYIKDHQEFYELIQKHY